jgi:hypothetical protein
MRRILLSLGFFILVFGTAKAQDLCKPGLVLKLLPALSRSDEIVPVRAVVTQIPLKINYNQIGFDINYPEGLLPLTKDIHVLKYPEGVYKDAYFAAGDFPSQHLAKYAAIGGPDLAEVLVPVGPVADLPFNVGDVKAGSLLSLQALKGFVFSGVGDCFTSDPTSGTVQITGPGGRGDVDGNGSVTLADAQWALRLLLKSATGSPGVLHSTDIWPTTGDGQITLSDALIILRMALGLAS